MSVSESETSTHDRPAYAQRCLKAEGGRSVWLVRPPGSEPRTLKTWPCGPYTLLKLALGIAQVQRQVRGFRRLAVARIDSPKPLGWKITRRGWGLRIELELEYVEGRQALDLLDDAAAATNATNAAVVENAARLLGRLVVAHADAGLFNRDMKLSNVIVSGPDRDPAVFVIDPVGVRLMRRREDEIARMLERLGVEPLQLGRVVPGAAVRVALRSALRPLTPPTRRAVMTRLRARRRR